MEFPDADPSAQAMDPGVDRPSLESQSRSWALVQSVAILDEESLLATCAYIDLNPVAAGIAVVPEASAHTSIKQRVEHVTEQGRTEDLKAAQAGSVAGSTAAAGLEEELWLCPVEDRKRLDSSREDFTLPERLARFWRSCRKLSMSGSCEESLAIRCENQARASPMRKGGARRVCALTRGNWPPDMPIMQVFWNSQSQESERGYPLSLGGGKRLPLQLSKPIGLRNGSKMPRKGGKMGAFDGICYVTGYDITSFLP